VNEADSAIRRHAVRALLLEPDGHVLLLRAREPTSRREFWITPGGGRDPDEPPLDCLRREVLEETGLADFEPGPLVWRREHRFDWAGQLVHQREEFFLVRVPRFEPRAHRWTHEERRDLLEFRWWHADEIATSRDEFVPLAFARHLRALVSHGAPAGAIDVGI
jgi:8-oxo-dGTP pyrophosphatase MutT (NUDIX family)